jgi:hypothetical protein
VRKIFYHVRKNLEKWSDETVLESAAEIDISKFYLAAIILIETFISCGHCARGRNGRLWRRL